MRYRDAIPVRWHFVALLIASASLPAVAYAVALTVTPPTVTAEYSGTITLDITGLMSGQAALVETLLDTNGNGAIDAGDMLVQSFTVTDGQALAIGGVRNTNIPGDEDGQTNGSIHTVLSFQALAEATKTVAHYVHRVSPASGSSFVPATAVFAVTQPAYAQKVVGQVTSGGTPVSFAVALLIKSRGGPTIIALTDAGGNFTLNSAPGSYAVGALKTGYVFDFTAASQVTIDAGATVTQNLSLMPADRTISGRLSDPGGAGLPGVQVTAETDDPGMLALVFTDADGNFSIPVSGAATSWGVDPSWKSAALLGYLAPANRYPVDVSGGDVSGISIQRSRSTALIYGTLRDDQSLPVAGIGFEADNDQYDVFGGPSDSSGNYVVGVAGGNWWLGPSSDDLADREYVGQSTNVTVSTGQALRQNFVVQRATAHLSGRVTDDSGQPVSNICVNAYPGQGGNGVDAETDSDGNFSLAVSGGTWYLQLCGDDARQRGLVSPTLSFNVSGDVSDIQCVARHATAQITGSVMDNSNAPIGDLGVNAFATAGASYGAWQRTDSGGGFSLGVFNGTWQVNLDCGDLQARGYTCPSQRSVTISGQSQTVNFTVQPLAQCTGDCGDDGQVTIDDLLTMVNVALGNAQVSTCQAGDVNGDGQITVDEILTAVDNALNGCAP
jgi:hypothetical protein